VTWHTIASHGICCRGPPPANLAVRLHPAALISWTLGNFDSYCRPLLRRVRRFPDPWSLTGFTSYGTVWVVLGVCRMHYTLPTGKIGSKEAASDYGIQTFPEQWHRALNEALRIRRADRARAEVTSARSEMIDDLRIRKAADGGSRTGPRLRGGATCWRFALQSLDRRTLQE